VSLRIENLQVGRRLQASAHQLAIQLISVIIPITHVEAAGLEVLIGPE
jgi:hypothetical protein